MGPLYVPLSTVKLAQLNDGPAPIKRKSKLPGRMASCSQNVQAGYYTHNITHTSKCPGQRFMQGTHRLLSMCK